jgi:hypothetical protein
VIIGFDFDGTLVASWSVTPLPGVRERLVVLPNDARTFIATNQTGPHFARCCTTRNIRPSRMW